MTGKKLNIDKELGLLLRLFVLHKGADGRAELLAYNFRTKQWQTEAF